MNTGVRMAVGVPSKAPPGRAFSASSLIVNASAANTKESVTNEPTVE